MKIWWAMLRIGLPAGAEFVLLFFYIALVYKIITGFGPAAQAGFGVGASPFDEVAVGASNFSSLLFELLKIMERD